MNPFSPKHPVSSEHFANRKEKIEHFSKCFITSAKSRIPKPDNIAILGDWGIGKTSLLNKFKNIMFSEDMDKINAFCVKLALSPSICKNEETFSKRLIEEVSSNFHAKPNMKDKIRDALTKIKSVQIMGTGISFKSEERINTKFLTLFLREFWEKNLKPNGIEIAVIMLDDVQYMLNNYKEGFYDLRTVFQELAEWVCNYMLIISGPEILFEINDTAEPFKRFFDILKLTPFDQKGTEEAIKKPLRVEKIKILVEANFVKEIYKISGGHPYFINFIMKEVIDMNPEKLNLKWLNVVYNKVFERLCKFKLEPDFNSASDAEKELLCDIARIKFDVIRAVDISKNPPPTEMLRRLCDKNLLIKVSRGKFKLYHPLFKKYILSSFKK